MNNQGLIVDVVRAGDEHIAAMMELQIAEFGPGWGSESDMRSKCALGGAWVALLEGRVVGLRVALPPEAWAPDMWADLAPCSPDKWREKGFERLALAKAVIVDRSVQGKGVGEQLLTRSFEQARREWKCDGMVVHVWCSSEGAVRIAKKKRNFVPFVEIAEHKDAWMKYSIDADWNCFYCGKPCRCAAIEAVYDLRQLE